MTEAEQITRASKSNLALAFIALDPERRRDISTFYAFCRIIDDIADDPAVPPVQRQLGLDQWKKALAQPTAGDPALASAVRELIAKYRIPTEHFFEIIAGCEMDLTQVQYETWDELRHYCHRVASVVGLISIEIFGYRDAGCQLYARELGLALQLTNILRDVGQDYANERRIYLPREEIARFGYSAESLAAGERNANFLALMNFQAERAIDLYARAQAALTPIDRRSMIAAEIMRTIYRRILSKMQNDQFQVFKQRYRLNKFSKLLCIARVYLFP